MWTRTALGSSQRERNGEGAWGMQGETLVASLKWTDDPDVAGDSLLLPSEKEICSLPVAFYIVESVAQASLEPFRDDGFKEFNPGQPRWHNINPANKNLWFNRAGPGGLEINMRNRLPFWNSEPGTRPMVVCKLMLKIRWGVDIRAQTGNSRQRGHGGKGRYQATGRELGQTQWTARLQCSNSYHTPCRVQQVFRKQRWASCFLPPGQITNHSIYFTGQEVLYSLVWN